ncbi:MAG TPA: ABC transporter permease [Candidatus Paceibacterota bacterium]|nr:ABC transporter permease [Candidatus Paceibacterota bacterium]
MDSFSSTISDTLVLTKRNLLRYRRIPQLLIFSTIQPIMFLLLFAYVFGGAIKIPGQNYINYLLPGILVETVLFGAMQTGIGLADDVSRGMIDRFRSLPMARSAVLSGRTITDLIRNAFTLAIMIGTGYLIGFRVQNGAFNFILGLLLTLLFAYAFSWISAAIGLLIKNIETVQVAGFIWIFPIAFASSIFVPVDSMPAGIRALAAHNPVSYTVNTIRALALGGPVGNNLWFSLIWIAAILAVFVPLGVSAYRKIA